MSLHPLSRHIEKKAGCFALALFGPSLTGVRFFSSN
jgi:hypothetical protein